VIHGLIAVAADCCLAARNAAARHPMRVMAAMAAMMMGAGSLAVAALGGEQPAPPVQQVLETVRPQAMQAQMDALESQSFKLYRSELTRSTDSAESILRRLGIDDPLAAAHLRSDPIARAALIGRAGRKINAEASASNGLLSLSARWALDDGLNFKRLVVQKTATGFKSKVEVAAMTASNAMAGGSIQSSLFAATDDARIPDAVAVQLAEIFSGDIDFHRALRKGDRFSVVYETMEADGEPMRSGRVLSAEFVNSGKAYQAMWFEDPLAPAATPGRSKGNYYALNGQSLRRAFLASPMQFSRVTSGFKMRFHPILQTWRAHLGVDYAAPTGTPVRSVGDGVVEFAGVQGGFGNVVFVKHRNNNTTVYGHLSRIDVKRGQSVGQSQVIGAVGATGWATGPHLHFEFRVGGVHRDPLTIAKQSEAIPVSAGAKTAFDGAAASTRLQLAAAASIRQVNTQ